MQILRVFQTITLDRIKTSFSIIDRRKKDIDLFLPTGNYFFSSITLNPILLEEGGGGKIPPPPPDMKIEKAELSCTLFLWN